jgi:hypothetical protein
MLPAPFDRLLGIGAAGACALAAAPSLAQQHDGQAWFQINTNVPLGKEVRVTWEQIARFSDRQDGLFQTEFGALLSYKLSNTIELGGGYRKVGAHNGNSGANEDRIRQQVVATFGPITTRLRMDERFNTRGNEIGFRLRPLVRYNHRLSAKNLALFVSHESFLILNSTSWGQRSGYERMRNIVGVVLKLNRQVSADIGYLNQYRLGRAGDRAQMDHAVNIQLTINLRAIAGPLIHD